MEKSQINMSKRALNLTFAFLFYVLGENNKIFLSITTNYGLDIYIFQ